MPEMLEIDGSEGEGGGQVLRTALCLSALTGRPFRLHRVRANRPRPGLAPQHLCAVRAAARLCQAQVTGGELRSTELVFAPQSPVQPAEYRFDVSEATVGGSAGAVTLLLQTVLLPLALAPGPTRLELAGGTHVPWSPPYEYLSGVFLPAVARMGVRAQIQLQRPGFYPAGGGAAEARIPGGPAALGPLQAVGRGALRRVHVHALAANLPAHIPQRMADRARSLLAGAGLPCDLHPRRYSSAGPGAALVLVAEYDGLSAGFTGFGERGKFSAAVAEEACELLLRFHAQDAPVDAHLGDQLLLPAAVAGGRTELRVERVTGHLLTNAAVIGRFLPGRIQVEGGEGEPGVVRVEGGDPEWG
ncbi:MAG: RNA 3'-terminal phosphate cyclase [Candidatus Latescibacterota bacterium]